MKKKETTVSMKEKETKVRKSYLKPEISIVHVEEDYHLLAGSPNVPSSDIQVIPGTEESGGDDDIIEG